LSSTYFIRGFHFSIKTRFLTIFNLGSTSFRPTSMIYTYTCMSPVLFCNGTRRYGVPAPFSSYEKENYYF